MLSVKRCYAFSAAHRLFVGEWDADRNEQAFGKCSRPEGHGHNYRLEITVSAPLDPHTGLIADRSDLDRLVRTEILDRLDHRDLLPVLQSSGFATATSENVCLWVWDRLVSASPGFTVRKVELRETDMNRFECSLPAVARFGRYANPRQGE